jgi:hypothetical protein
MKTLFLSGISLAAMVAGSPAVAPAARVIDSMDIAPVWSAHPVRFCLLTRAPWQCIAFYDANRQLTVAQRKLGSGDWKFTRLPVTMGALHLTTSTSP